MNIVEAVQEITGHKVNLELRSYLEEFPFSESSYLVDYGIVYTPEEIVTVATHLAAQGYYGRKWPVYYLVLGLIDVPCYHCIDLRETNLTVYMDSLSEDSIEFHALGPFAEWIDYSLEMDIEHARDMAEEETQEEQASSNPATP